MKAIVIISVIAAGLAGALLATVVSGEDEPAQVVTVEPSSDQGATAGAGGVTAEVARERPASSRPQTGGGSFAGAAYIDPDDRPIGRAEINRVRDAALAIVGGGIVTDIDRSDDLGVAYEVEVVQNAQDVDVRLDADLNAVTVPYDD